MESAPVATNVLKFCELIINEIERNQHLTDEVAQFIDGLKYFCFGKLEERNCFTSLSHDEKLASIIQIADLVDIFKLNPNQCLNVAETLISHPNLSFEICKGLKTLISSASKMNSNIKLISQKLFNHNDFTTVPIELVEEIVTYDSTQLELHLISLYSEQNEQILSWDSESNKHWVLWCCKSAKIFCKLSSILNQLLILVKNKRKIIHITRNFVENVFKFCNKNRIDFIALYPIKLQYLVSLLIIDLESLPEQYSNIITSNINEDILLLKEECPSKALLILTQFNKWETFIT